jgi:dTDP-4-amino-4,6-dideoxygalactose transaminase
MRLWLAYDQIFSALSLPGLVRPRIPAHCAHNAHMYQVLLPPGTNRADLLADLNRLGVNAVSHYVPLHSAPAGRRYARGAGSMAVTDDCSERVVRLPLWVGMPDSAPPLVANHIAQLLAAPRSSAVTHDH